MPKHDEPIKGEIPAMKITGLPEPVKGDPEPGSKEFALKQLDALLAKVSEQLIDMPTYTDLVLADRFINKQQEVHGTLYPDVYKVGLALVGHLTNPTDKVHEFLTTIKDGYLAKRKQLEDVHVEGSSPHYHGESPLPAGTKQIAMATGSFPLMVCANPECPSHNQLRPGRLFRIDAGSVPSGVGDGKAYEHPVVAMFVGQITMAIGFTQPDPKTIAAQMAGHRSFFYAPLIGMLGPCKSKYRKLITEEKDLEGIDWHFPMGAHYRAMAEDQIKGIFPNFPDHWGGGGGGPDDDDDTPKTPTPSESPALTPAL